MELHLVCFRPVEAHGQPSPVSIDQVAAFRAIDHGNSRPVQPLGDRSFD